MLGLLEHDVLSSIEVPLLPNMVDPYSTPKESPEHEFSSPSRVDADKFDLDVFALTKEQKGNISRNSYSSSTSGTVMGSYRSSSDKRAMVSHRNSVISARIPPIQESPHRIVLNLPEDESYDKTPSMTSVSLLSTSPSQSSMRSIRSDRSASTTSSRTKPHRSRESSSSRTSLASKLAPTWLFNPFNRSVPSEPQTSSVSASSVHSGASASLTPVSSPIRMPAVSRPTVMQSTVVHHPKAMAINSASSTRTVISRTLDEETLLPPRTLGSRRSPMNTPPRDEPTFGKRRSTNLSSNLPPSSSSSSPGSRSNPSRPESSVSYAQSSLARRWEHMFPQVVYKHDIKWKSVVTPSCLPLTVEHFPTAAELESSYDVFSYDFVVDPREIRSFLVKPPRMIGDADERRRVWALAVMRGMAAVRLAQGFQFVLRPQKLSIVEDKALFRHAKTFLPDEELTPKPVGAAEVLQGTIDTVYLSMSNEIHRLSYTGEAIQVRRYVRHMPSVPAFRYQCLIWPKLGVGYTEMTTSFTSHGLENYHWNR